MSDSHDSPNPDRGSLVALRMAYYGQVVVAVVDYVTRPADHPWYLVDSWRQFGLTAAGLALIILGLMLRLAAGRALGQWWSLRAEIAPGQPLMQTGAYRYVRHPAYLGMLIVCLGIPVALQSIWAAVVMALGIWPAVAYRISIEEALLERHFGDEYRAYARRTPRLFPRLW